MEPIVDVEITGPDADGLLTLARGLVEDRLAGSANLIEGVRSVYRWEGEVVDAPEAMVRLHTRAALVPAILARVEAEHPYEVPGFRVVTLEASPAYHSWLISATV